MNPPFTIDNSPITIQHSLKFTAVRMAGQSETASLDAQTLLAHITGQTRSWLLTHPEVNLTPAQKENLAQAISRLDKGTPLPYIIGHWEFYGLEFTVTPDTLIPRPETELLIEQAINWLKKNPGFRSAADIGTGSGCIAVSLAVNIPDLYITATDISAEALKIAGANAEKYQVSDRIDFIKADLLPAPGNPLNAIFANLPYIPTQTLTQLDVFEKEPALALDGGPDGLDLMRRLLPQAVRNLISGGLLLLEIEASQGQTAIKLTHDHFPDSEIMLLQDFGGHDRLIQVQT
jgi:release factor glutamine methyltransferase